MACVYAAAGLATLLVAQLGFAQAPQEGGPMMVDKEIPESLRITFLAGISKKSWA